MIFIVEVLCLSSNCCEWQNFHDFFMPIPRYELAVSKKMLNKGKFSEVQFLFFFMFMEDFNEWGKQFEGRKSTNNNLDESFRDPLIKIYHCLYSPKSFTLLKSSKFHLKQPGESFLQKLKKVYVSEYFRCFCSRTITLHWMRAGLKWSTGMFPMSSPMHVAACLGQCWIHCWCRHSHWGFF